MDSARFTRKTTATAGAAFIVLAFAPPLISGVGPVDDASELSLTLAEDSSRIIWSGWLGFVAALAFVVFGAGVASRFVDRGDRHLGTIATAGTTIGAGALAIGAGMILVAGLRGEELAETGAVPTDSYAAAMIDAGTFLYAVVAVVGFALLALAVGLAALRSASVPNWFAGLSLAFAAALMLPFGLAFYVLIAFPVWILIAAFAPLDTLEPVADRPLRPTTA